MSLPLAAYDGVTVAVAGSTGFIGRWIVRAALERKARVVALVAPQVMATPASHLPRGVDLRVVDLCDLAGLRATIRGVRPALVVNAAGYGVDPRERDPVLAYAVNARGVANLCEAVAEGADRSWAGQQLVHLGSALEYGNAAGSLREDTAGTPTTLYGQSKLAGTVVLGQECHARGLRGVAARLFMVYGPGERRGRLLPLLIEAARSGVDVPLTQGTQQRDFTFVGDAAEGVLRLGLVGSDSGGIVNLATGRLTSIRDFALAVAAAVGLPPSRLQFGALPTRPEEMRHGPVDIGRLRASTGWIPPTDVAQGVRLTVSSVPQGDSRLSSAESLSAASIGPHGAEGL